jgi:hypothetical protein
MRILIIWLLLCDCFSNYPALSHFLFITNSPTLYFKLNYSYIIYLFISNMLYLFISNTLFTTISNTLFTTISNTLFTTIIMSHTNRYTSASYESTATPSHSTRNHLSNDWYMIHYVSNTYNIYIHYPMAIDSSSIRDLPNCKYPLCI